jgi:exosortase/archaeosortase family protein
MNQTSSLINTFSTLPKNIRTFFLRALVTFIAWKCIYFLILYPIRIPDLQLTRATAISTTFIYNQVFQTSKTKVILEPDQGSKKAVIYVNDQRGIGIADACNGLELYVLYLGFIFCLPAPTKRKISFALVGITGIYILNSFRCFGLTYLFLNRYPFANFAHHYLFKMVIYIGIFFTWVVYSKRILTGKAIRQTA